MVWKLTGLPPSKFYKCIRKNLGLFDPKFESREIVQIEGVASLDFSEANFAANKAKCDEAGGMVVFAEGKDFHDLIDKWSDPAAQWSKGMS